MDGWMATEGSREAAGPLHMPEHPQPRGRAGTGERIYLLAIQPRFQKGGN